MWLSMRELLIEDSSRDVNGRARTRCGELG